MLQAACRFRTETQPRVEPPLHRPPRQVPRPCHRRLSRDPPAAIAQRPASSRGARSSTARVAREAASRAPSPESPEKVLLYRAPSCLSHLQACASLVCTQPSCTCLSQQYSIRIVKLHMQGEVSVSKHLQGKRQVLPLSTYGHPRWRATQKAENLDAMKA